MTNYVVLSAGTTRERVFFDDASDVDCQRVALVIRTWLSEHRGGVAALYRLVPRAPLEHALVIGTSILRASVDDYDARRACIACRRPIGHVGRYYAVHGGLVHVGCGA